LLKMGKILGCGIDIEELARFERLIPSPDEVPGFSRLVFTEKEMETNRRIRPDLTFPLAFSCKEAFFKAFGVSWTNSSISWKDIELIFNDEDDLEDYSINLGGYAEDLFHKMKCSTFDTNLKIADQYVIFEVLLFS
jgi:phosphopantetheine--protein transferase-like protein